MPLIIFPFASVSIACGLSSERAGTVALSITEPSFVYVTITHRKTAVTMTFVVSPIASVHVTAGACLGAAAVLFTIDPVTLRDAERGKIRKIPWLCVDSIMMVNDMLVKASINTKRVVRHTRPEIKERKQDG